MIAKIVIVILYVSLFLELTVFHVPSVASSLNIWKPREEVLKFYSEKYTRIFEMSRWKKFCLFILPLVVIYLTYAFPSLLYFDSYFNMGLLFESTSIAIGIGIVLMLMGRYITLSSVFTIRKNNKQKAGSFTLHDEGMFSKSRNPGLLGLYIFLIGIWFVLPSIYFLLGILFYMAYMHFKVRMEEDFLSNRFSEEYKNYFSQTKRYV